MAGRKETLWQADFSLGAVRPEAVERDDLELIDRSVRVARNTIGISGGGEEGRPGTAKYGETLADRGREVDLGAAGIFDLHIVPSGVILYTSSGTIAFSDFTRPWVGIAGAYQTYAFSDLRFWVVSQPEEGRVLIGSSYTPIQEIKVTNVGLIYQSYSWDPGFGSTRLQPFFNYYQGVSIFPSARTGGITVGNDGFIWTAAHVGKVIRYIGRQILITGFISSTLVNATVLEELPPTYNVVVASASGYQVGDAVEHDKLGGKGIISNIAGTTITVVCTGRFDGFDAVATPKLVGPNAAQVISSVTATTPGLSFLWDIQMLSSIHGYPNHAATHGGRLFLCGFPSAALSFAASAVGAYGDFTQGTNDDDGFIETISADKGGSLRYMVSAEDLVFLTTKGIFYHQTRDGSVLTPKTINPIKFSAIGCADIEPVAVDDGCVFADAVGKNVYAATLAGDVYRSWRTIPMAKYHAQIPVNPVMFAATSAGSETTEQFLYVTRADGKIAVCQWDRDAGLIAWRLWDTLGAFRSIYPCFGTTRAVVDRTIAGAARRFMERFTGDAVMDCSSWVRRTDAIPQGQTGISKNGWVSAHATHLIGHTATVYMEGWDLDDNLINASGYPVDGTGTLVVYPDYDGDVQIGLAFESEIEPWARRSARTQRGTREVKRIVQMFVTVQGTGLFHVEGFPFGGYRIGEDLTLPPPMRDWQAKIPLLGRRAYESINIVRRRPGKFRLLKLGYRVVI